MTDPSMVNQQKPFSKYNEAIAAFNRMFCYVIKENAVVRLSDFAIFRPGRFARSSYVNWFYLTEKNKQRSVARDWLKSAERNQRESLSDLQTDVMNREVLSVVRGDQVKLGVQDPSQFPRTAEGFFSASSHQGELACQTQ